MDRYSHPEHSLHLHPRYTPCKHGVDFLTDTRSPRAQHVLFCTFSQRSPQYTQLVDQPPHCLCMISYLHTFLHTQTFSKSGTQYVLFTKYNAVLEILGGAQNSIWTFTPDAYGSTIVAIDLCVRALTFVCLIRSVCV